MFIVYDDNAKHLAKYYKTLKGLKNRIKEELENSDKAFNVGDGWKKTPLISLKKTLNNIKKDGSDVLDIETKRGYNLILRIKRLEFEDNKKD